MNTSSRQFLVLLDKLKAKTFVQIVISIYFLVFATALYGQQLQINGVVRDHETSHVLPFASIVLTGTGKGTISNAEGYFSITIGQEATELICTYIGYQRQIVKLKSGQTHYEIELQRSPHLISEITVKADNNDRIYRLFNAIRNEKIKTDIISKSYFESKSFCDKKQVELVTAFYNLHSIGYEISNLDFKAGKVGFQKFGGRYFANIEASKSITNMSLFESAEGFPENPFTMKAAELKKKYWLDLYEVVRNDDGDTIWVVSFIPINNKHNLFSGKAWLMPQKQHLLSIQLECQNCETHPFIPLTDADSLSNVNISVNRTFKLNNNGIQIDHADFRFDAIFNSRYKSRESLSYPVHTEAILYAYDPSSAFYIPKFDFPDSSVSDYSKIFAFPFIPTFWYNQKPNQLSDQLQTNEKFFADSTTFLDGKWQHPAFYRKEKIFTTPHTTWSEKRTFLNTDKPVTKSNYGIDQQLPEEKYHLEVKIFMDLNRNGDSLEITTTTILDPYSTFFNFPSDSVSNCFINLYFDLCESYRRKFQLSVSGRSLTEQQIEQQFAAFSDELNQIQKTFLKETARGTRYEGLTKWNEVIRQNLGIDNMQLFNVQKK